MRQAVLFVATVTLLLSGCGERRDISTPSKAIIGHWVSADGNPTFFTQSRAATNVSLLGEADWWDYEILEERISDNYLKLGIRINKNEKDILGSLEIKFSPDKSTCLIKLKYLKPAFEKTWEEKYFYVDAKQKPEREK